MSGVMNAVNANVANVAKAAAEGAKAVLNAETYSGECFKYHTQTGKLHFFQFLELLDIITLRLKWM